MKVQTKLLETYQLIMTTKLPILLILMIMILFQIYMESIRYKSILYKTKINLILKIKLKTYSKIYNNNK
jgi:hypothetical protein